MYIHYTLLRAVYFDKLEENGTAIEYTLRFKYDNGWHTNERADEFVNIDVRTWRCVCVCPHVYMCIMCVHACVCLRGGGVHSIDGCVHR